MVDGARRLTLIYGLRAAGCGASPAEPARLRRALYEVYATTDSGLVAVGALEPQFYARLLELLEIPAEELPQFDRTAGPSSKLAP